MKKLEISYEVADGITLANLKNARDYHKGELKKKKKNPKYWIHPEDQVLYVKYIDALDLLIDYYGG
jgi:hypothetical protein